MSEQRHKAFSTLEGREVNGYTIQILEAGEWGVRVQLTKQRRTPIVFTVEAAEHKFEMTAVLNDLGQELAKLTREAELGPKGEHSAILRY